jgi:hypothetical protein
VKYCPRCKQTKKLSEFRKNGIKHTYCRLCQNEYNQEWYKKNRERGKIWRKNGHLRRSYGITLNDYNVLLEAQNNVCAICFGTFSGTNQHGAKKLAVDHCHDTGIVRGLLCENCNRGIGMFKHKQNLLESALKYIKLFEQNNTLSKNE